jgi:predicted metal-dependent phosphoesterase TrpH
VDYAIKMKLRHIAITDHDTLSGIAEAQDRGSGKLEVIPGIEINTVSQDSTGRFQDVHILGYFIDPTNRALEELLQRQRAARKAHAEACIERLTAGGVKISMSMVEKYAGRSAVGKAHLAQAIIVAGAAADATEAFQKFLTRGSDHYIERQSTSPQEAIEAINSARGIASIAHPGKSDEIYSFILKLKRSGLRAVEAYHRIHSVNRVKQYVRFANRNGLLVTGGSDCHGPFREHKPTLGTVTVPSEVLDRLRAAAAG